MCINSDLKSKPIDSGSCLGKSAKGLLCVGLSVLMSQTPQVAFGSAKLISNQEILFADASSQSRVELEEMINQDDVIVQLQKWGVTAEEAKSRVAALSPAEVQQFSKQIEEARAGGSILVTVVLVLLIVFLVQRI